MNDNEQMGEVVIFMAEYQGQHCFQSVIVSLLLDKNYFFPRENNQLKMEAFSLPTHANKMILDLVYFRPILQVLIQGK